MSDMIWRRYVLNRNEDVWFDAHDEEVGIGVAPPNGYVCFNTPTVAQKLPVKGASAALAAAEYIPGVKERASTLCMTLPTDSAERKEVPLFEGAVAYFPAAFALMARTSKTGNDKHNAGEPLHHARGKSMDHSDCVVRHLVDIADIVAAIEREKLFNEPGYESVRQQLLNEAGQFFWRAGAYVQELCEKYDNVPLAPRARVL